MTTTEMSGMDRLTDEARRHALALEQCSIFAADVGEDIAKAMTDAAAYIRRASQAAPAPSDGLREALEDIARQKVSDDLEDGADIEGGYDGCIYRARAALTSAPAQEGGQLMGGASPCCQECKGTGIISRPYMVGLLGGDLYTMSVCPCTKDPAAPKTWKEPPHD